MKKERDGERRGREREEEERKRRERQERGQRWIRYPEQSSS